MFVFAVQNVAAMFVFAVQNVAAVIIDAIMAVYLERLLALFICTIPVPSFWELSLHPKYVKQANHNTEI